MSIFNFSMSLLSINNANKTYAGTAVLKNAKLELFAGEVHALMGENGAGKSTLIKILAGVVSPDSAVILLHGKPLSIHSAKDSFAAGLRFIHQELNVVPQLSVAENLFLGQLFPKKMGLLVDWRRLNEQASLALGKLGISHIKPTEKMARLSTGDKMLVKIASALLTVGADKASVYVMDEPTAALTEEEANRLFEVIAELKTQGCAVVYISHRIDEVFTLSDRITVMRDGETISTQKTTKTSKKELIRLMTGREMTQTYPERTDSSFSQTSLEVTNLATKTLRGISFHLAKGEILGVVGLADAGQSQLLRVLMGIDKKTSGTIKVNGQKHSNQSASQAWSRGFAFVPAERRTEGLVLSRSIRNNVSLANLKHSSFAGVFLNRSKETRLVAGLAKAVELKSEGIEQLSYQLSGGNQQKLVFARALAVSPEILLLDEPTRGVDVGAKFDIYVLLRDLVAQGTSILMSSSDLPELLGMCDRILVMKDKALFKTVSTRGLTQEALLSLCYGHPLEENVVEAGTKGLFA